VNKSVFVLFFGIKHCWITYSPTWI